MPSLSHSWELLFLVTGVLPSHRSLLFPLRDAPSLSLFAQNLVGNITNSPIVSFFFYLFSPFSPTLCSSISFALPFSELLNHYCEVG